MNRQEAGRAAGLANRKHGMHGTREYRAWVHMKHRCYNPSCRSYHSHGGRGIKVHQSWVSDPRQFLSDMGPHPGKGYSLDRVDNDGDYEPGNCRWATPTQQARNTRSNRRLTFKGETLTVQEWANKLKISRKTLTSRLRAGWSAEDTLGKTPRKKRKS